MQCTFTGQSINNVHASNNEEKVLASVFKKMKPQLRFFLKTYTYMYSLKDLKTKKN